MSQMLLDYDGLKAKGLSYSRVHLWRLERDGKFPRRVKVSAQRIAWVESEIDAFVAERIAARDAKVQS